MKYVQNSLDELDTIPQIKKLMLIKAKVFFLCERMEKNSK